MTREICKSILESRPHDHAYMKHFSRIVRPLSAGFYEMEDMETGCVSVGNLDEAVNFLFFT